MRIGIPREAEKRPKTKVAEPENSALSQFDMKLKIPTSGKIGQKWGAQHRERCRL